MPSYRDFRLGGLRDLTGLVDGSLVGGAFGMVGAGVLYHLAGLRLPYVTQWYLGGWADLGNVWQRPQDMRLDGLELGGALLLMAETALGPLELGYGYNSRGRGTVYLQAGVHFAQPVGR
jgi:outer membrane translocation and assembly module TamA